MLPVTSAHIRQLITARRARNHHFDRELFADPAWDILLEAFIAAVHDATHPAQFLDVTPEVARKTVRQHIGIVKAIEGGDPAMAGEAMRKHLDFVLRYSHNK